MFAFLKLIPGVKWAELAIIFLIAGLMAAAFMMQYNTILRQRAQLSQKDAEKDKLIANYASAAASASATNAAIVAKRVADQGKNANEAQQFTTRVLADANDRRSADERMRIAFDAIASSCTGPSVDSAITSVSPPASSPGDMRAYVQRRLSEAAGRIGDYADQLRPAAEQCVADYDSLN